MGKIIDTDELVVEDDHSSAAGVSYFAILRGFDLNGSLMKLSHATWLRDVAAPYCQRPDAYLQLYGNTDRSGGERVNYLVSKQRLYSVQRWLVASGAPPKKVFAGNHKFLGEDFLEDRLRKTGDATFKDGKKNDKARSVVVILWPDFFAADLVFQDHPIVPFGRTYAQKKI